MINNLKKCLFGNQIRGDAMDTIVASIIAEKLGLHERITIDECAQAIVACTRKMVNGPKEEIDEVFIKLIYGLDAYKAALTGQRLAVEAFKPYTDSDRYMFRLTNSLNVSYSADYSDKRITKEDTYKIMYISNETEDPKVTKAKTAKDVAWKCIPKTLREVFEPYGEVGTWMATVYSLSAGGDD